MGFNFLLLVVMWFHCNINSGVTASAVYGTPMTMLACHLSGFDGKASTLLVRSVNRMFALKQN